MRVPDTVENSKLNWRRWQKLKLIGLTLAEKIGESAERSFFAERKERTDFDDLRGYLDRSDGEPPRVGDEIVAG
jgi:hypothetical protein